jgi:toxin secretion/phage lysis holin
MDLARSNQETPPLDWLTVVTVKVWLAGLFAIVTGLLGGNDLLLRALVVFVIADVFLGSAAAFNAGKLSSYEARKGIVRKLAPFVFVALAQVLDGFLTGEVGMIRAATIWFLVYQEFISITEHAGVLGFPVPEPLVNAVAMLRKSQLGKSTNNSTDPPQGEK